MSNRDVVDAFASAFAAGDMPAQQELLHPDFVEEFPQSGEVFRGPEARRQLLENWPKDQWPSAAMPTVIGSSDQWILTPTFSTLRVIGTGDEYTGLGTVTYPNGETWHLVEIIKLRDGKISHLISYFAAPFDAPDWRAPYRDQPS